MANGAETLLNQLLSTEALNGISSASGVGGEDVSKILQNALPALLKGANKQTTANSAEGFAVALADHAKEDTSDMKSFFKKVDLNDGNKIVAHLLGNSDKTAEEVAKQSGVTKGAASSVLSAAAPLLMSLLGKQTNAGSSNQSGVLSAVGSILGNTDFGGIAKAALAAYAVNAVKQSLTGGKKKQTSKKKKNDIDLSDGVDLKDVIGIVGKIVK